MGSHHIASVCSFALSVCIGNVLAAPPAVSLNTGSYLADGITSVAVTLNPLNSSRAYSFNLQFGASFDDLTFLDIDTEGSDQPGTFGVFDASGTLVASAQSRGSGPDVPPSPGNRNAHQISFGTSWRPSVGNGLPYWGQEGDIPAGLYYVIVAMAGSTFSNGWTVVAPPVGIPTFVSLNFNSNCRKTIPAGYATAPSPTNDADFGVATFETPSEMVLTLCDRQVAWVRLSLTNNIPTLGVLDARDGVTPLRDVTYLDISQENSDVPVAWNMAFYKWDGSLANATSVSYAGAGFNSNPGGGDGPWGGGGSFAQLSYGTASSRGPSFLTSGQTNAGFPFANQNGATLPADQYYIAITTGDAKFHPTRFGAINKGTGCHTLHLTFRTNNRGPSGGCPSDLNGDKKVDDADFIEFCKGYQNYTDLLGDLDANGIVDDDDFLIFSGAYDAFICP